MYRDLKGRTFTTHAEIRTAYADKTFPAAITDEFLKTLGIEVVSVPAVVDFLSAQTAAIVKIDTVVAERLGDLAWRLERATERELINEPGETVADVMREREAWRRASNRWEIELEAMTALEDVVTYELELVDADWPLPKRLISQYKFRSRFTMAEKIAITETRKTDATLEVVMGDLDAAQMLDLDSADLLQGLQYLVQAGLLNADRITEILA